MYTQITNQSKKIVQSLLKSINKQENVNKKTFFKANKNSESIHDQKNFGFNFLIVFYASKFIKVYFFIFVSTSVQWFS